MAAFRKVSFGTTARDGLGQLWRSVNVLKDTVRTANGSLSNWRRVDGRGA
jgi:hypothetical protein